MAHGLDGWLVGLFLADHTALSTTFSSSSSLHIRRNSDFFTMEGGSSDGLLLQLVVPPTIYPSFSPSRVDIVIPKIHLCVDLRGHQKRPLPPPYHSQAARECSVRVGGRGGGRESSRIAGWGRWGTISYLDKSFACKWKERRKRRIRGGERPTQKKRTEILYVTRGERVPPLFSPTF